METNHANASRKKRIVICSIREVVIHDDKHDNDQKAKMKDDVRRSMKIGS